MTGETATFHTQQALAYGTQMIGAVTPVNGGTEHVGLHSHNDVDRSNAFVAAEPANVVMRGRVSQKLVLAARHG